MDDDAPRIRTVHIGDDTDNATGTTEATDTRDDGANEYEPFAREDRPRSRELARLEADLAQMYVNVGLVAGVAGGQAGNIAGTVIAQKADTLAGSWIDLAERDPRVRAAIKRLLQGSAWSGVVFAHVGVFLPIAAVTGILPEPVAQKVFLGLAVQDPELFAYLSGVAAQQQAGTNGHGAGD